MKFLPSFFGNSTTGKGASGIWLSIYSEEERGEERRKGATGRGKNGNWEETRQNGERQMRQQREDK